MSRQTLAPGFHGVIPEHALKKRERDRAFLETPSPRSSTVEPDPKGDTSSDAENVLPHSVPYASSSPTDVVSVELVFDGAVQSGFVLTFGVVSVSVNDYSVTVGIDTNTVMQFVPKVDMRFIIKHRDATYPVLYMGGEFSFPERSIKGLSFIRLNPDSLPA